MLVKGLAACPCPRLLGEPGKGLLEKVSPPLQGCSGPCITPVLGHPGLLYMFAPDQLWRGEMGGSNVWDLALPSTAYARRYGVYNTLLNSRGT